METRYYCLVDLLDLLARMRCFAALGLAPDRLPDFLGLIIQRASGFRE